MSYGMKKAVLAFAAVVALLAGGMILLLRAPQAIEAQAAEPLSPEQLEAALAERAIGDPKAPVTLYEHSSLSCPHCAHFHRDTLPRLKTEYVDTGKLRIVFRDFPLNAPALAGSLLARCLPADKYFDFTSLVFSTQEAWMKSEDSVKVLRQNAALAGLPPALAESCLGSEALKKGIVEAMQEKGKALGIESTPTFTIDDRPDAKIVGAMDYSAFKAAIDTALESKKK